MKRVQGKNEYLLVWLLEHSNFYNSIIFTEKHNYESVKFYRLKIFH